ncbi:MAG: DNA-directed RNA polymerase subunit beta', partial [Chlorobiaceae bacterium]|nr:DNA-directed RNA polymerase subunit beta' [Chlorobiaceae bacterium]
RKANAVKTGESNRPLKSLSDALKGKQGRFRQNLLGKRVDYSGRSVIVVGPELKLHECGLPKSMAIELFQPFVIRRLVERGIAKSVKSAKKLIDKKDQVVWDVLEKVIDGRPVLLNRAPTLHRLGIQAFQPVLIEGKAIQIHPLVCTAFNADFDGDQMAVHVPLSQEAQLEAALLMLSSHNLILPQSGKPVTVPSQDMVLGMYYLTKSRPGDPGEGRIFYSHEDVLIAYNEDRIGLHAQIFVHFNGTVDQKFDPLRVLDTIVDPKSEKYTWLKSQLEKKTILLTTVGRVIFNQHVPDSIGFINRVIDKKVAKELIGRLSSDVGNVETAKFLDNIKEVGFHYAMKGGLSVGLSDAIVPDTKVRHIKNAQKDSTKVVKEYNRGTLTDNERYNQIVDVWQKTSNIVAEESYQKLKKDREGFNPLYMMLDSGARGSREQVRQLTGMRGLIARPQKSMSGQPGEIIENPIISNLKEGLTVLEYFISTHGARKGLSDTSLKTADAGYLTRRLHDVAQDVIVTIEDCGTTRGLHVYRNIEEETSGQIKFREKIRGRVAARDIYDTLNNNVIVKAGEIITEELGDLIQETAGVEEAEIRSVLTCESKIGICSKCYGTNLSVHQIVEIGEAVGVIAAQSIGEPGTQLTLRTFHQGGTAQGGISETETKAFYEGQLEFEDLKTVEHSAITEDGVEEIRNIVVQKNGKINIVDPDSGKILKRYVVPHGAHLHCIAKALVKKDQVLFSSEPNSTQIIAELHGRVKFADIEKGVTYKEEVDPQTGFAQHTIINWRSKLRANETREPRVLIIDESGEVRKNYPVPIKSNLYVEDGQKIVPGDIIAKVPRNLDRAGGDITAGLPKVTELFEARIPSDPAIVSEIDGYVSFGSQRRSSKEIKVKNDFGEEKVYYVQVGKHVLANEGDEVKAGDAMTDGAVSPQDILRIQGPNAVQQYLVNEIQKVYQINAGVEINDKHLEVIVRQMLQKVRVEEPGDTELLPGDLIDRSAFVEANENVAEKVRVTEKGDAPSRIQEGQLYKIRDITKLNRELRKNTKNLVAFEPALQATSHPVLLGITSAALQTESVISAASFQETTKVLTDAAVAGKIDYLAGLKENVIVGKLIPAGTGLKRYRTLSLIGESVEQAGNDASEDASTDSGI